MLRPTERQPLLENSVYSFRGGARLAEVQGRLYDGGMLLVLAVYKVPAGLCRKALRENRRRRLMKMGLLPQRKCGCDEQEFHIRPLTPPTAMESALESVPKNTEIISRGFLRSSSRRSEMEGSHCKCR